MENTDTILSEQIRKLPPDVRSAILAVDLDAHLMKIAGKHHLRTDEAGKLANETMLVMVGIEHPNDLVENLARELRLPREAVNMIAADVNEEIFLPIRASLMKLHERDLSAPARAGRQAGAEPTDGNRQTETRARIESREEILKEIEQEASVPTPPSPPPTNLPIETPVESTKPQLSPATAAALTNPIERKLSETVHLPREDSSVAQQKKTIDPYRELLEKE